VFLAFELKKKLVEKKPNENSAADSGNPGDKRQSQYNQQNKKTTTGQIPVQEAVKKDKIFTAFQSNMNILLIFISTVTSL
jgi:hypothetical protein